MITNAPPAVPDYAYVCLILAFVMIFVVIVFAIEHAVWTFRNWWWELSMERYENDIEREAHALNAVRDEVEVAYKKVHFRHNIHCGHCGRFAKQAEGWAEGMADCKYHGVSAKFMTHPSQGHIEVIVETIPEYVVATLEDSPMELTPLWDTEMPEIVVDYVPDADGLPVFTMPLTLEDLQR